ncbi:hypothetical protein F511_10270 [Dorcoceras hygrometricum]|uniref:Uncharacterized protein n=1 Tax=Dorcoceras hygrometricum TaxID=472368 RepID=A0A2Z7A3Y4_9LAMI|nr:hypothetical protein F511_10270 [Dorcoceras hygrometricum]
MLILSSENGCYTPRCLADTKLITGNGDRPAEVPVCPAWLPEDPATEHIDPNNTKASPSAITARWFSDTTDQSITTPMIELYISGMTHLSADHNVALSQGISIFSSNPSFYNILPTVKNSNLVLPIKAASTARTKLKITYPKLKRAEEISGLVLRKRSRNTATSRSLSNVDSSHLTDINRKSFSRRAQRHQSLSKQRRKSTAIYRRSVRMNSIYRGFHWGKR